MCLLPAVTDDSAVAIPVAILNDLVVGELIWVTAVVSDRNESTGDGCGNVLVDNGDICVDWVDIAVVEDGITACMGDAKSCLVETSVFVRSNL